MAPCLRLTLFWLFAFLPQFTSFTLPPSKHQRVAGSISSSALRNDLDLKMHTTPFSSSKHIYMVDDDVNYLRAAAKHLNETSAPPFVFNVVPFKSSQPVLDRLDACLRHDLELPSVIVSAIEMPELLRSLKAHPVSRVASIPVVVVADESATADRIAGYRAGCAAYLPKPPDPEELVVTLVSYLGTVITAAEAMANLRENTELLFKRAGFDNGIDDGIDEYGLEMQSIKKFLRLASKTLKASASDDPPGEGEVVAGVLLTPRDRNVLLHLSRGLYNKEIAVEMKTEESTIQRCMTNLLRKTGLRRRAELLSWARDKGVVNAGLA
jgi:DNA-binding NarL/FixJ family response regulator